MTKSDRNKTIDFNLDSKQAQAYVDRCLSPMKSAELNAKALRDQIILGDCLTTMTNLPPNSFDFAFIDPPYNLTKSYDGQVFTQQSLPDYQNFTRKWLTLLLPLLKPQAVFYVACDWQTSIAIAPLFYDYQLNVQNRITWQRDKGRGAKNNWKNAMEDLWFVTKDKHYTFNVDAVKIRRQVKAPYMLNGQARDWQKTKDGNFRDTYPSNFWDDISIPYWSMSENTGHPTQKPEKLLAKLLLANTQPGNFVLDPFLGSGTTAVTAKKLGRNFLGIEQSRQYVAWAQYRLDHVKQNDPIQGYVDGVFWERNTMAAQKRFRS